MITSTTNDPLSTGPINGEAQIDQPKSANEAAALVYPDIAKVTPAFIEKQASVTEAPTITILDLEDKFWASTIGPMGNKKTPTVFDTQANKFLRYNPSTGIYEPITEHAVTTSIIENLHMVAEFFPPRVKLGSFLALKNPHRIKAVVLRAKDLLAVNEDFFHDRVPVQVSLANGILQLDGLNFLPSTPGRPVREALPIIYDPNAKCPLFLEAFLRHILEPDDIDVLQRGLSQVLEGINHSQTILVLTGDSGWGKTTLIKILGTLLGWNRIGIIREHLFRDELELGHYHNKHLLVHPDLPTEFLARPEASIFKQLVGGDPLWANIKGGDGRMVLEGHYPVILACNGRPRIHLDQDTDAWLRRLVVLSFKTPTHEHHLGKMAENIITREASGILNWLVEGRAKLLKDRLQLVQTPEQKARAATLLLASDSPAAFVRSCIVKKKDGVLGVMDLYCHYQQWCRDSHIRPFTARTFTATAREEIEIGFGMKLRHDLEGGNGKAKRGWRGLGLVGNPEA